MSVVVESVSVARAVITSPPIIAAKAVNISRVIAVIFLLILFHLFIRREKPVFKGVLSDFSRLNPYFTRILTK